MPEDEKELSNWLTALLVEKLGWKIKDEGTNQKLGFYWVGLVGRDEFDDKILDTKLWNWQRMELDFVQVQWRHQKTMIICGYDNKWENSIPFSFLSFLIIKSYYQP